MKSLWVPVSAAIAQQRKVETIANNVANANTPGFKKDDLVFKEHLTVLEKGIDNVDLPRGEWAPKDFYQHHDAQNSYVKVDGSFTNFNQGALSPTGNALDLGIKGKGFIEVLTPNGVQYTRAAQLSISRDGDLVTDRGYKVLSAQAENADTKPNDRIIKMPPGKISINLEGGIFINGTPASQISLVEFKDIQALKKSGHGMYANVVLDNVVRQDVKSSIHQGFVEQSNVNPINEMSELIKANRHFESIQRVIKAYDTMTNKGVNEIAKF